MEVIGLAIGLLLFFLTPLGKYHGRVREGKYQANYKKGRY